MAERIRTRFLVVGSGVAGLHTAWRASPEGDVMILTKRSLFDSATAYAQGGIAAALDYDLRSAPAELLQADVIAITGDPNLRFILAAVLQSAQVVVVSGNDDGRVIRAGHVPLSSVDSVVVPLDLDDRSARGI